MAIAKWNLFGAQQPAQAAQPVKPEPPPVPIITTADAKKFGLTNFGNTCYANSVIQALYFCTPFRELILQTADLSISDVTPAQTLSSTPPPSSTDNTRQQPERRPSTTNAAPELSLGSAPATVQAQTIPTSPTTLFSALRSLYSHISSNPAEKGTVEPRAFIDKLKELNELFRSNMHQDAHEFLMFLLNKIVEELEELKPSGHTEDLTNSITSLSSTGHRTANSNAGTALQDATLVHRLFEGVLTSETRCLTCETVSSRDECFLDLSIDIEQNSSVSACLRQFSASEMLCQKNKFFCDGCCDLQEAEKRMKIKKLPNVLALHLKRFKYQEDVQKYIKLAYRVAFPLELRLFNTVDDTDDADRLYELFGIVIHIGSGPHHGHYISIIKVMGHWMVFDDENVTSISESEIPKYFGDTNSGSAYVLYYQAVDINLEALGLQVRQPEVTYVNAKLPADSVRSSTPPLSYPPGLEEGDSSDLSDPPFPVTPSQPSPFSSFEQEKKHESLQINTSHLVTVTASPHSSPVAGSKTPKSKPSIAILPTVKGPSLPRGRNPSETLEPPPHNNGLGTSPKFPSWMKRTGKRGDHSNSEAVLPAESPVMRSPSWFSGGRHDKKSRHSRRLEADSTQVLSATQSDTTSTATGTIYGSDNSPASASSLSQASHAQPPVVPVPLPPPISFPRRHSGRQSSMDGATSVPPGPEHKRSLASLMHGKTASPSLPARPATAGENVGGLVRGEYDMAPPLPSPIAHNHGRPQSSAGFADIAENHTLDSFVGNKGAKGAPRLLDTFDPVTSEPQPIGSVPSSGQSSGAGSTSSFQKAKRKLSLTAPLLGFGKRDKHKSGPKS